MKKWSIGLQKKERAKLNSKIDALALHGADLIPGILAPTGTPNIFKLKAQGQVKLRPMVCEGPGKDEVAFTFLLGAKEISWDYDPLNAPILAAHIRNDLLTHSDRRIGHERVN
ncbi:MAG: hypothetical protein WBM24_16750 [Candidatus Sulfotelmatobacter sp.]